MYHMLSLALCGTEQYMCHLRLVTAYSLIVHQQHMLKVFQPTGITCLYICLGVATSTYISSFTLSFFLLSLDNNYSI